MSRWIFFGTPLFGHANPTFSVVSELVRRGEKVVYYNTARFEDAIRATGAEFRAYRRFPALPEPLGARLIETLPLLAEASENLLDAEAADLKVDPPDFVLHDCAALWGAEAARYLGAPRAATFPTFVVNKRVAEWAAGVMPRELLPGGYSLRPGDIGMLTRVFLRRLGTARKHGLPYEKVSRLLEPEFNLVFTSAELQPFAEDFAGRYAFVGSPTLERQETGDFPFDELGSAPLVYISLGTLFNDKPEFFELCFEALGGLDVQVLLSRGARGRGAGGLRPPANFLIRDYVPQMAVLRRAAAFVTHGGVGSSSEALHAGVPQIFLPQIWDGHVMAQQVSDAGAGLALPAAPTAADLRSAVRQALQDASMRARALELGRPLTGGTKRAVDAILGWAARQ